MPYNLLSRGCLPIDFSRDHGSAARGSRLWGDHGARAGPSALPHDGSDCVAGASLDFLSHPELLMQATIAYSSEPWPF